MLKLFIHETAIPRQLVNTCLISRMEQGEIANIDHIRENYNFLSIDFGTSRSSLHWSLRSLIINLPRNVTVKGKKYKIIRKTK
jgi:hypothetical protein